MQDNWVSVDDKMPENGKEVLVWKEHATDIPIQAYFNEKAKEWRGSAEVRECMISGYAEKPKLYFVPTHWMPLPEPPNTQSLNQ